MKKVLTVLLIAFTALQASGQETFGVAYPDKLSEFERVLLETLEVGHMRVDFSGNLGNKRIYIDEVVCRDGVFSTTALINDYYNIIGVSSMQVFVRPISQDSIIVNVTFNVGRTGNRKVALRNDNRFIGMETSVKELMKDMPNPMRDTAFYPMGEKIPVMAYTTGIKVENEVYSGVDYCGLRDALVHPREWYAKFGIKNYIYYTVRFE